MKCLLYCLLMALAVISCKNKTEVKNAQLCQRNEFSKNGVDSVREYKYSAKMGKIDPSTKTLYATYKYDSLGNLVYFKGKDPLVFIPYEYVETIRNYYYEPKTEPFTYKLDYTDTILNKIAVFDNSGDYIARIQHFDSDGYKSDSIFVNNHLEFIKESYLNTEGKDSLIISYKTSPKGMIIENREEHLYSRLENGLERREVKTTSKDGSQLNLYFDVKSDEKGRMVYGESDWIVATATYSDNGLVEEYNRETHLLGKTEISREVIERYKNGLIKVKKEYSDKTIESGKTDYSYSFYPYSKAILE